MSKNYLEIGIYYYMDDETGKKVYDKEEMLSEFENKLENLINKNKQQNKSSDGEENNKCWNCYDMVLMLNEQCPECGNGGWKVSFNINGLI